MSTFEEKAALEVIKPAAGFLAAAMAPKIEKVRAWAVEKELNLKLKPDSLAKTMERYLEKLSVRVSEITSITFPQAKLDIFEAYEPLHMCEIHHSAKVTSNAEDYDRFLLLTLGEEEALRSFRPFEAARLATSKNNSFLLVDGAGMGKSTFSKYVIAKTLFKSEKIPLLLELRNLNPEQELIEHLAKELDFPGEKFDRELFYKLIALGKFFVILDGFDEIKLEDQNKLAEQIKDLSLKAGKNSLLVTSRPQEALPDLAKSKTLQFTDFTHEQANSLIDRYDKISRLNIGERLKKEIPNIPSKFIESPMLVSLLYRTFGVNNSIADRVSTFYDEIYHALYKGHDLINKNGFARQKKSGLDFEDFRKLLRALCHYMMLGGKVSFQSWSEATSAIEKAVQLSRIVPSTVHNFLDDLLVAVPLMQRDGNEYRFYHKTILEYFAAEFIVFSPSNTKLLRKILLSRVANGYFSVFDFVADINKALYDEAVTFYFAEEANKLFKQNGESKVISTIKFLSDSEIGLWKADEKKGKGKGVHFSASKAHHDTSHETITWCRGTLRGEEYYLALSWTYNKENLHKDAWHSISEASNVEFHNLSKVFDGLDEILQPNTWVDLNDLSNDDVNSPKFELAIGFLESVTGILGESNIGSRNLSAQRISDVLGVIKSQRELDDELEQFM